MNYYLVIGFVILMVIRYFYSKSQDNSEIQDLKESETANTLNRLSNESSNEKATILNNKLSSYPEISKNMFLNPDEGSIKEINDKSNDVSIISIDDYNIVADVCSSKENINGPDESNDATDKLENEKTVIVQTSKNKWLYPDDEFGKMERGRSF